MLLDIKSDIHEISYDTDKSLMINRWLDHHVITFNNERYKNEVISWVKAFHEFSPKLCLSDLSNFQYKLSEEIQEWSATYSRKNLGKLHLQKYAVVVSQDFMTHIAIENILDEYNVSYEYQYFLTIDDAMFWLLNN
ncbi:hypothetical protein EI427_07420 [Flammeovirga pectinis]|uniref:STAS/SEC14 domain-containing protein n=1 Tax=Flammeovirga pectinis TaxID=2494373 RepID=A0A3Q9FP24_9BACT|nr:hypothetical protein [Flammeovirga pectinis]AZQ62075.1 hypothetical protein EI427_07420 [Flammeovirga pectinis]